MLRTPLLNTLPNVQEALKEWKDKYDQDALVPTDVVGFLESMSPYLLSVEPLPAHQYTSEGNEGGSTTAEGCVFDENGAKSAIIDALEELICGDNPQQVLERIRTEDNIPSVCGRVFKTGEPTYSCRECSKLF